MTAQARPNFDAQDVTIACAVSLLAQLVFVLAFSLPSPKLVEADISNANAQPIAVAITPVLKLGSQSPTKLPSQWQRHKPPPPPKTQAPVPSPLAEKTLPLTPKTPVADAAPPSPVASAAPADTTPPPPVEDAKAPTTVASAEGSEQGAANGTETDPLKARAVDRYRAELAAWFVARFEIRGKIPFDKLKTLEALVSVSVADRKVASFSIVRPSGDSTFDSEVQATLTRIQSSGVELPAPPQNYPELLAKSQSIRFQCNVKRLCE